MRRLGSAISAVLGVWTLVTALSLLTFPSVILANLSGNGYSLRHELFAGFVVVIPFLLAVAVGLTLILARDRISALLFEDSPFESGSDPVVTFGAAVLVLGLWFSVVAVTGLLRSAATGLTTVLFSSRGPSGVDAFIFRQQLTSFAIEVAAFIVEFGAGMFFVLRSKRVAAWVLRRQESDA
jgi:hypothetical protein